MDADIAIELTSIKESLKRIEDNQSKQWDRLDEHSTAISNMKGWIAGVTVAVVVGVGIAKLL